MNPEDALDTLEKLKRFGMAQRRGVTKAALEGMLTKPRQWVPVSLPVPLKATKSQIRATRDGSAGVRKAKGNAVLPVYDSTGRLRGCLKDPKDLLDEGSVDEAVYDARGQQVGFADAADVIGIAAAPTTEAKPKSSSPQKAAPPASSGKFGPKPAPPQASSAEIQQAQQARADTTPTADNVRKARQLVQKALSTRDTQWAANVLRRHMERTS